MKTLIESISTKVREHLEKKNNTFVLDGYCAIASVALYKELEKVNISCKLAVCENSDYDHVFVLIDDIIVDITATQFGKYKKVEIVDIFDYNSDIEFWRTSKIFNSPRDLIDYQKQSGWERSQIACVE